MPGAVKTRVNSRFPLPPPIQDHLIELLAQRFQVRVGEGAVQAADAVRVRTRAADGAVELGLADFAGWALGAVAKGGLYRASP
jgi:hypothetical protein